MKKALIILPLTLALLATGCNNLSKKDSFTISINYSKFDLVENDSFLLSVEESENVVWECSNTLVCEIESSNEKCVVHGKAAGSATITATSGNKKASCLVTVQPKEVLDPSISIENQDLDLSDFVSAIDHSEPTKAVTNTKMYDVHNGITLSFTSTLVIDYSDIVKTMYTYSYQSLNEIESDTTEFISTHSGVYYSKGSTVGEASENGINWNNDFEGSINLLSFNLNSLSSSSTTITNNVLEGDVSQDFFKDPSINNGHLSLVVEHGDNNYLRVRRTYLSFDMIENYNGTQRVFNVISDTKFTYKAETIDYEW